MSSLTAWNRKRSHFALEPSTSPRPSSTDNLASKLTEFDRSDGRPLFNKFYQRISYEYTGTSAASIPQTLVVRAVPSRFPHITSSRASKEINCYPRESKVRYASGCRSADHEVMRVFFCAASMRSTRRSSPETIVDAGANIGVTSIYFANRYPGAKIFAVEAEASNFAMLVKNTQAYPSITRHSRGPLES